MRGITPSKFQGILAFIRKYHQFGLWLSDEQLAEAQRLYPAYKGSLHIKFVDASYDSRDGDIWFVRLKGHEEVEFRNDNIYEGYEDLNKVVMDYLKGNTL